MVNEKFQPDERQERILEVFKQGRDDGGPWGLANPKRIEEELGLRKQYVNRDLQALVDAGWIEKVNRGLYRFVTDPREDFE